MLRCPCELMAFFARPTRPDLLALILTECQACRTCYRVMPTYEYACGACGSQWEETQRITAPPTEVCPKCAQSSAHRLISGGTNFILKGGGWYSDLYSSSSGANKKADSVEASSSESGNKAEAKTDTKSEAKPASTPPAAANSSATTT